ncbi:MAG TPA: ATP-dependent Clp protease proteolytic subunit [Acidimicrobiales bacterium]|nr:ATP-dependent Clp protease proteolytic subunit [Acidimicrobiales bacterium]
MSTSGVDDVRSALLERRVVLLRAELDTAAASELAATLLTLDATGDTSIELRMSSSHGPLDAALSVIDVIDVLGVPVHAVALGTIEGGPVGVLVSCSPRRIGAHAVLRLREPDVQVAGTANDLERALAAQGARRAGFLEHLADRVGRPFAELDAEWSRGAILEARDAVTLGYADEILEAGAQRAPSDGPQ